MNHSSLEYQNIHHIYLKKVPNILVWNLQKMPIYYKIVSKTIVKVELRDAVVEKSIL